MATEAGRLSDDQRDEAQAFGGHQPRWMIIDDAFNVETPIKFLATLVRHADRKVFPILDNLRVRHSNAVKA